MAEDVGSLIVRIEANLNDFNDGLNRVSDKVDGFGSGIKKLGGIMAGVFAGGALLGFLKSSIDDASEAANQLSALNAVITSTGGKAGVTADAASDLAGELESVSLFSAETIMNGESLLLTFTSIGKEVFPQATETALNMSQALGQDMKSSSIQLGKALNDPINGMTALSRVGVSFTEKQKEQIKALQESGDIMGAQKIILAELNTEFGNAARAAGDTFAGKLKHLDDKFGEIKETIGNALIPVISTMAEWFIDKMPAIQETAGIAFDKIASVVGVVVDIFKANFMPIIQEIFTFIQANWPAMQSNVETVFYAITDIANTMWQFFKDNILPIFQEMYSYIMAHMPEIKATVQSVFDAIIKVVGQAWAFFKDNLLPILASIYQEILNHMPQIESIVSGVFTVIKNVVKIAWDIFQNFLLPILKALWDFISPTFPLIGAIVKTAFDIVIAVVQKVVDIFVAVTDAIKTAVDWLKNWNGVKPESKSLQVKPFETPTTTPQSLVPTGFGKPIGSFATGINRVPMDMLARIHEDEAVVPANNNPFNPNASNPMGGGVMVTGNTFNVRSDNDIKMIAREIFNLTTARNRGSGVIPAT